MPKFPPIELPRGEDTLTARGAQVIAAYIATFWLNLGHTDVRTWTEEISMGTYGVRSNLVNGRPPLGRVA